MRSEVLGADIFKVQKRGGHFVCEKIGRDQVLLRLLDCFYHRERRNETQGTRDVRCSEAASLVVSNIHRLISGVVVRYICVDLNFRGRVFNKANLLSYRPRKERRSIASRKARMTSKLDNSTVMQTWKIPPCSHKQVQRGYGSI